MSMRVFLCHARDDKPAVRELYTRLRKDGFQPWLDEEDLIPGQNWRLEIPKQVRAADVVVVCLSKQSITKTGYVQKEIAFALDAAEERPEGTIYLIPLRLEECEVPERLGDWQWVDFFDQRGYEKLLRALRLGSPVVAAPAVVSVRVGDRKVNPKDGLEYVWIPSGEFWMGATPGDNDARYNEKPRHRVRISKGFWLSRTPVTVAAYARFVKDAGFRCRLRRVSIGSGRNRIIRS